MKTIRLSIFLLCASLLIHCSGDEEMLDRESSLFKSSEDIHTWSLVELQIAIGRSQLDVPLEALKYDVSIHDVEYETVYKGETITASGRIFVPDTKEALSTVCFSHGTTAAHSAAYTALSADNGTSVLLSALASLGFVVVAPDLIGFGASKDLLQTYYIEEPTATATIDNIYASRTLATSLGANVDNELYLAGYSQGGYTTMATHKYIEEQGMKYFELQASFPAAGGYEILGVQEEIFSNETYDNPFYLGLVAVSYKEHYEWEGEGKSLSMFFNEPFASEIPALVDGSNTSEQINDALNDTLVVLVNADYLQNPNASAYSFLIDAYKENSPTDFIPAIPLYMYHGDADVTVPYANSVQVYNALIKAGASKDVVTFTTIEGGTHGTGAGPYLESLVKRLLEMEAE